VRLSLKPPPPEDCDRRVTIESFAASLDHSIMILVSSFLSNAFDNLAAWDQTDQTDQRTDLQLELH
jgi:hypothetical protein